MFAEMVNAYAKDSESRIRKKGSKTIANRDGYEAIVDDKAKGKLSHLIDIVPDGDRVYMVISAGPKNHAAGDAAEQFRDSFRLLSDPDPTGSTHATSVP
jgi:predicted Zn-dependent protease